MWESKCLRYRDSQYINGDTAGSFTDSLSWAVCCCPEFFIARLQRTKHCSTSQIFPGQIRRVTQKKTDLKNYGSALVLLGMLPQNSWSVWSGILDCSCLLVKISVLWGMKRGWIYFAAATVESLIKINPSNPIPCRIMGGWSLCQCVWGGGAGFTLERFSLTHTHLWENAEETQKDSERTHPIYKDSVTVIYIYNIQKTIYSLCPCGHIYILYVAYSIP